MPKPGEYKNVQSRILHYAQEIGWKFVPRADAEQRRGFDPSAESPPEKARHAPLFFDDLLYQQVRRFNPLYTEAPSALAGQLRRLPADIEQLHFFVPNHGKLWKSLMRAHLGDYERLEARLRKQRLESI